MKKLLEEVETFGIKETEFCNLMNCFPVYTFEDIKFFLNRSEIIDQNNLCKII